MALNCNKKIPLIFSIDIIINHEQEHYTQGSYTIVLNYGKLVLYLLQSLAAKSIFPLIVIVLI